MHRHVGTKELEKYCCKDGKNWMKFQNEEIHEVYVYVSKRLQRNTQKKYTSVEFIYGA